MVVSFRMRSRAGRIGVAVAVAVLAAARRTCAAGSVGWCAAGKVDVTCDGDDHRPKDGTAAKLKQLPRFTNANVKFMCVL